MKNTPYKPNRLIAERGHRTIQTRRPLENWGMSYHCAICGATKVLIRSQVESVYHQCKGFHGMLETQFTLIYGVAK